ncbi:MAG: chromate transporter [Acidocella sp.]|nr:chromate transporter [Acidocella sp.]
MNSMAIAPDEAIPDEPLIRPGLGAIFGCFFTIGSQSFGGGTTAWLRREVVTKRGWLTDQQFLASLAICQITPGPNPLNMAVFLGSVLGGGMGALAGFAGMMAFPTVLCLSLGALYYTYHQLPGLEILLGGLGAVAIGMNLANAIRLTRKNIRKIRQFTVIVLVAIAAGIFHFPLLDVLAIAVPLNLLAEIWKPS